MHYSDFGSDQGRMTKIILATSTQTSSRGYTFEVIVVNTQIKYIKKQTWIFNCIYFSLQIKGRQKGAKLLLLLIKLNNLKATGFDVDNLSRCLNSLVTFDVMTLVTSRRHLQLPCTLLLEPLTKGDVLQLFRHHAPHVQAKEFEQILQEHCYGLPPLVLRVAKLVCGDSKLSYTAQELAQVREAIE